MKEEIREVMKRLKEGMIAYISEDDAPYTEKDIDVCFNILKEYLEKMHQSSDMEEGMKHVKSAVLALNQLNEACDYCLIETNEREDICEIIIMAGHEKGYNDLEDDITEEWREW